MRSSSAAVSTPLGLFFITLAAVATLGACAGADRSITAPDGRTPSLGVVDTMSLKPPGDQTVAITIYRQTPLYLDGVTKVRVQGVVQCSRDGDIEMFAGLYQSEPGRGESYNGGQGRSQLACTTSPKYWSVEIYPLGGPFTPGPGIAEAFAWDATAGAYTGKTSRHVKLVPVEQM